MSQIQARKIAAYVLLPGIIPRAKRLFASGFSMLAFLMAQIYAMVRLLPHHHPYLNPANIGEYGLRHVIAAAANHLVIKKENIDQIVIFFALLLGTVLLFAQFIFLAWTMLIQPAAAAIFVTANPTEDIALILLDKVFGIPNFFCNPGGLCTKVNGEIPYPFHTALHSMFQFYSMGLLLIGVLIFLYFIVVVVAETATTGTPFGQRFQNVWVPIRLVMAVGLLLPLNYGYNSGQYITFYAAKIGSGFATNTWLSFNRAIEYHFLFLGSDNNPLGEKDSLVGVPANPQVEGMVQFMSLIHSCGYAYDRIQSAQVSVDDVMNWGSQGHYSTVKAYLVKRSLPFYLDARPVMPFTPSTTYLEALDFYNNSDIIIRFGQRDASKYKDEPGNVGAVCGEIRIPVNDLSNKGDGQTTGGADYMLESYFEAIKTIWFYDNDFQDFAARFMEIVMNPKPSYSPSGGRNVNGDKACMVGCSQPDDYMASCAFGGLAGLLPCETIDGLPTAKWRAHVVDAYSEVLGKDMVKAWELRAENSDIEIKQEVLDLGWGGAGVWYNKIAEMNGAFVSSVLNGPDIITYPKVMEEVADFNRKNNQDAGGLSQFAPITAGGAPTKISSAQGLEIAKALNNVYQYWVSSRGSDTSFSNSQDSSSNMITNAMNLLLGTSGIFQIRDEAAHIHPLAQLTTVGKGLVESAIRNIMGASASAFAGGALTAMDQNSGVGKIAQAMSDFLQSVAFIGLTAGILLFYILPFLPFLYFFFAVGEWVKAIFEAMVGVPLWALAHLRLDGEGLPGEAAKDGYFLILEIALRPIFTVIALIAATVIFTAQVRILNSIWDLVLVNSPGYDPTPEVDLGFIAPLDRSVIDEFFYTLIYTIVVYMMATAAFKLINEIPNNLLRWMGAGISSFGDINSEDLLQGLQRYVAVGGITIGRQAVSAVTQASSGAGRMLGSMGARRGGGGP